jgi:hypothetical protein
VRRVFAFLPTRKDTVPPVRLLGLGSSQIVGLPTDTLGRVQPHDFDYELRRDAASPTIVVLQAGEINTGASDPFRALVPIAKNHRAWVHADGAFGLWAGVSPRFKHFVEGVEMADSWATDGHKWLNVPFDSGLPSCETRKRIGPQCLTKLPTSRRISRRAIKSTGIQNGRGVRVAFRLRK